MKRTVTFLIISAWCLLLNAQLDTELNLTTTMESIGNPTPIKAQWDIQQSFNATQNAGGSIGMAGVVFYNNQYWVSLWATDTLIKFAADGSMIEKFQISGLSGIRAITTDGTYLYMTNNTTTIYRVDPVTKTLAPPHITSSSFNNSRFLTYDASLDGGLGGFWTGNFNTDIESISKTGTILSTITAATHTLTGMYGAAIDRVSSGGPYLWVFHQAGANNTQVSAISISSGLPSALTYDIFPALQSAHGLTSSLAGGCCISNQIVPGELSLIGVSQGTPANIIFSMELDPTNTVDDIEGEVVKPTHGYTQIPEQQAISESFMISFRNLGMTQADTVYAEVSYYFNENLIGNENLSFAGLASGLNNSVTTSNIMLGNGKGSYMVKAVLSTSNNYIDANPLNDTISFQFEVSDSVYARDNGISNGSPYYFSSSDWAYIASLYELNTLDTVHGIWIQLEKPVHGDTTFAVAYNVSGGIPSSMVALGNPIIIDSTISVYYLPFVNPLALAPGQYAFGCYEGLISEIGLAQSESVYTASTKYFYQGSTSTWNNSSIETSRFIRPIFKPIQNVGIENFSKNIFVIYPNPSSNIVHIDFKNTSYKNATILISDQAGRTVKTINPETSSIEINVSNFADGMYFIHYMENGVINKTEKIVVSK